jgi:isochorismate hydrolase
MSYPNQGRKLQPKKDQRLTSCVLSQQSLIDRTADALERDFGHLAHANKLLAREIDSNVSTIKNLRKKNNLPSLLTAVKLAQKSPTYRAFLADILGLSPNNQSEKIKLAMQLLAEATGTDDEINSH